MGTPAGWVGREGAETRPRLPSPRHPPTARDLGEAHVLAVARARSAGPAGVPVNGASGILTLQRLAGNAAVCALLRRETADRAEPTAPATGRLSTVQRNMYWKDGTWGPGAGVPPPLPAALTKYWETTDATQNNLYRTKAAAHAAAYNALGIQDKAALNHKWKWDRVKAKGAKESLTLYPDATNNETRVLVDHPDDPSKSVLRRVGHHGNVTGSQQYGPLGHYHTGVVAGQVYTAPPPDWPGYAHVVMPHFYYLRDSWT